jgi:hypothetical protein
MPSAPVGVGSDLGVSSVTARLVGVIFVAVGVAGWRPRASMRAPFSQLCRGAASGQRQRFRDAA